MAEQIFQNAIRRKSSSWISGTCRRTRPGDHSRVCMKRKCSARQESDCKSSCSTPGTFDHRSGKDRGELEGRICQIAPPVKRCWAKCNGIGWSNSCRYQQKCV